jgi:hypothetical protein
VCGTKFHKAWDSIDALKKGTEITSAPEDETK